MKGSETSMKDVSGNLDCPAQMILVVMFAFAVMQSGSSCQAVSGTVS